ncbi:MULTISPECIES: hypothetical protein [Bombella]|uniref:Uncharacterized protein n=1 Tax=Bombella pollinis TaxID=2967337 RepID=A0ABT3WQB3_9PROT|nr:MULTISPECIES: hypothetical protein [Bombella]MCX5620419.1 hypothetical protein [Bombella pollinis]MUG03952.1 hypothetical protein [Bombella sp. ESL0378]MUG90958.1 hypothetical protein [Bombella sp. ESL0385]
MPDKEKDQPRHHITDLKAGAHVMTLDAGVFCVFHAPGQTEAGPSGLPGIRISRAPGSPADAVEVVTFAEDGWMGAANSAALVRIRRGPAGIMVTTYQDGQAGGEAPRLQVIRLIGGVPAGQVSGEAVAPVAGEGGQSQASVSGAAGASKHEVVAHVQRHGDVGCAVGEWVGKKGSKRWIEGFSITPSEEGVAAEDIEYQAVLGRGWLSPWAEGGQFCGSRGMSLPILGLRVRLKGEAAQKWSLDLVACFTDGTEVSLADSDDDALQAESLAPLEAFCVKLVPARRRSAKASGTQGRARSAKA